MMKKIALIVGIFIMCHQFLVAQSFAVFKTSDLKQIEDEYETWGWEYGESEFIDRHICFSVGSWWYVVSYESFTDKNLINDRVFARRAFLYKTKLDSPFDWGFACRNPLFEHSTTNDQYLSYDPQNINTNPSGTSCVNIVTVDGEKLVVVIMGMYRGAQGLNESLTEVFVFFERSVNENESINFDYIHTTIDSEPFRLKKMKNNLFYDIDGNCLKVHRNEMGQLGFIYDKTGAFVYRTSNGNNY